MQYKIMTLLLVAVKLCFVKIIAPFCRRGECIRRFRRTRAIKRLHKCCYFALFESQYMCNCMFLNHTRVNQNVVHFQINA